jgi:hypothetical protein
MRHIIIGLVSGIICSIIFGTLIGNLGTTFFLLGFVVGVCISVYNFASKLHLETQREYSAVDTKAQNTIQTIDGMLESIGTASGTLYTDVYKEISKALRTADASREAGGNAFEAHQQAMNSFQVAAQTLPDLSGHNINIAEYQKTLRAVQADYDAVCRNYDRFSTAHQEFINSIPFGLLAKYIAPKFCKPFPLRRETTGGKFALQQDSLPDQRPKLR